MIRVGFIIPDDNKILAFSVEGHSGLSEAPHDVLCAAVSAMTELVINTVTEEFGAELDLLIREEKPLIRARLIRVPEENGKAVEGVLRGFRQQLLELRKTYPSHLTVSDEKKG